MWEPLLAKLEPAIDQALAALVPALIALVLAWLQQRRRRYEIVTEAVRQVEEESWDECEDSRKERVLSLVRRRTGPLTRMPAKKVGKMVEKVLPKVREQLPPKPVSVQRRSSVDVVFRDED